MRSASTVLRGLLAAWLVSLAAFPAVGLARGESSILRAMNSVRARHHLPALHASRALARAASRHSSDMARSGVMYHGAFQARISRYAGPRRLIGENLAWSSRCSGRTIVRMWLHSAPHRRIMLTRSFRRAGVGVSRASHVCFVTADFTSAR
jgi:uncharacterized protein YkwD